MSGAPSSLSQRILRLISQEVIQSGGALSVGDNLFAAGMDSMAIMQVMLLLEEHFGVTVPMSEVTTANFETADKIAQLVARHQQLD